MTYPRGPKILKGAIVMLDEGSSVGNVIDFQYNPSTLKRSFAPQYIGGQQNNQSEGVRFQGAPTETITVSIQIDAVDKLEAADSQAGQTGIHPQLAALELLVSPSVAQINTIMGKLNQGTIEILPTLAPLTVFIFGPNRVVPVRVNDVTVDEETHDAQLNPIRANVSLSMTVLTYSDLAQTAAGYQVYMNYQTAKESMASSAWGSLSVALGSNEEPTDSYLESL